MRQNDDNDPLTPELRRLEVLREAVRSQPSFVTDGVEVDADAEILARAAKFDAFVTAGTTAGPGDAS